MNKKECLWYDRKHFLWFPFSFTKYFVHNGRLYTEKGLLTTISNEVLLYRIVDISISRTLFQKIFKTGTIAINTRADSDKIIELKNISNSMKVKNLLSELVENSRESKRVTGREFYGTEIDIDNQL